MWIIKTIMVLLMILILGLLHLFADVISRLYCWVVGIVLFPLLIGIILAIITTQWIAVAIYGALIGFSFVIFLSIGWFVAEIEIGQEYFYGLLYN